MWLSRTTDSHLKRIISTNCCIHTVVPPDDGPRYARNMWRLKKYRVIQNDCRGVNNLSYTIHLVLQMQPHVISFYGVTSRIRFMFLLFPQVSWN